MRKRASSSILAGIGVSITLLFTACVKDTNLELPPLPDQSFVEEFDTTASAIARGWKLINVSDPKGSGIWQQGGEPAPWFSSWSNYGNNAGFIGADYTSTSSDAATISNWLVSPAFMIQNGDKLVFYTRSLEYETPTGDFTDYGNSLQVRFNKNNDGINVGNGLETGDFSSLMLDINPTYLQSSRDVPDPKAYPTTWTRFEVNVFGLSQPVKGRFAFRYLIEGGGSNGLGSGIAIDNVVYKSVGH